MRKAESRKIPGEQLTFHGWTKKNEIILAVVEFPDGNVEEIEPTQLKFTDHVDRNHRGNAG